MHDDAVAKRYQSTAREALRSTSEESDTHQIIDGVGVVDTNDVLLIGPLVRTSVT